MRVVENRFTDAGNQFILIDTSLDILADCEQGIEQLVVEVD